MLPGILDGTVKLWQPICPQGSYFGGRSPKMAASTGTSRHNQIHNLIRGVAPPYPGAFTEL